MEERLHFVHDAFSDRFPKSELCARYGVSRRIGYKWLERFEAEGRPGLTDRSHAPHHCSHRITPAVADLLVAARRAHPHWGARKLLILLGPRHPELSHWPAPSTVADLLARRARIGDWEGDTMVGPAGPRPCLPSPVERRTGFLVLAKLAAPHHAWERGTDENTNGLIRQYVPKGQSMAALTDHACTRIATTLNQRLGFRTPEECYVP
jgi:hypothetical protein